MIEFIEGEVSSNTGSIAVDTTVINIEAKY